MSTVRLRPLALVVLALALTACTTAPGVLHSMPVVLPTTAKPLPVVDTAATPMGWVPVDYGDAQISVPASFAAYYPGQNSCHFVKSPGALFLDQVESNGPVGSCPGPIYQQGETVVNIIPLTKVPLAVASEKPRLINGVKAYFVPVDPASTVYVYDVPSLGVEVSAQGRLAGRIVSTLTRSPRTVVLAPGAAPAVPSSWQHVSYDGIASSVPATWSISRTTAAIGIGGGCAATPGVAMGMWDANEVLLNTDKHLAVTSCPAGSSQPEVPAEGLQIDSGPYQPTFPARAKCLVLHGLTACPATAYLYSVLVLKVTVPGQSKPVIVSIGLAGNGMEARTILYSLRTASTNRTTSVVAATACAHNDKTIPATVWTQLVINGYMVCPVTVKRIPQYSASEAVARDVKNDAIPSTLPPLLARVGSKHGGLVGQPPHSLYWVLIAMPRLVPDAGGPTTCGTIAPLKGFSFDLVNANTGKWVTSAEWWPQELELTPAPQYRAAWRHRQIEYKQFAQADASCMKRTR